MKINIKKFALIVVFLTVIVTTWSTTAVRADGWFDYYGEVAWEEERMHLDNLAIFLKRNPDMIGYFGYYSGRKKDQAKVKRRVKRAIDYLIKQRQIEKNRLVVIHGGSQLPIKFILQPVSRNAVPPEF